MAEHNKQAPQAQQAAQGPQVKVLRIGIVQGGKLVHERVVKSGQNVTIGESPKNTFAFPAKELPSKQFTLFQAKGEDYVLHFTEKMTGKIAQAAGAKNVEDLVAAAKAGGSFSLPLDQKDRGKITVEDVTVLFQFVAAPPESARVVASTSDFRPKLLESDDLIFMSFLGLFTALASVLMIYVVNAEVRELTLDDVDDRIVEILLPTVVDEVEDEVAEAAEATPKAPETKATSNENTQAKNQTTQPRTEQQQRQDVVESSALLTAIIGTHGEGQGETEADPFADSDANLDALQQNLSNVNATADANSTTMGIRSGQDANRGGATLSGVGSGTVGEATTTQVKQVVPKGRASVGGVEGASAEGSDAVSSALKKYAPQIKSCYDERLGANPNLSGRIAVGVDISAGRVTTARIEENTTGDKDLETCVVKKVRGWRFPTEVTESGVYFPFSLSTG